MDETGLKRSAVKPKRKLKKTWEVVDESEGKGYSEMLIDDKH